MSVKCESCSAPSDMFLCGRCVNSLRDMLASFVSCGTVVDQVLKTDPKTGEKRPVDRVRRMAGLIEHVRGYAVGQSKRGGEQVRHTRREPAGLDGDQGLAETLSALPEDSDNLEKARRRRAQAALDDALAAGGVNAAASRLLTEMHSALGQWALYIAGTHGMTLDWRTTTGFAHFLSVNVAKIANDRDAGHLYSRVHGFVRRTERIINRPVPPRECGPCPTLIEETRGRRRCATPLTAPRAAKEVTCPECEETHDIKELVDRLWSDLDQWHFTQSEVLLVLATIDRPLPPGTFKSWRRRGKLIPRGWRRPGETVAEWHVDRAGPGDRPVYRLEDLRALIDNTVCEADTPAMATQKGES